MRDYLPRLYFLWGFVPDHYSEQAQILVYLCKKWKLRDIYKLQLFKFGFEVIPEALAKYDVAQIISRSYDKEIGINGFLRAITEGRGSIEAFLEYLFDINFEMDDDCNIIDYDIEE